MSRLSCGKSCHGAREECGAYGTANVLHHCVHCSGFVTGPGDGDCFLTVMRDVLQQQEAKRGAGLRILTESITSPTLTDQLRGEMSYRNGVGATFEIKFPEEKGETRA